MALPFTNKRAADITTHYRQARRRLFCLDYDGTLRAFTATPQAAIPSNDLLALLKRLAGDPANTVAIVSGRDQKNLEDWFGGLPIGLSAEHGHFMRPAGGAWQDAQPLSDAWQVPVQALLKKAALLTHGALIEEKRTALCFHYRKAQSEQARTTVDYLVAQLSPLNLQLTLGNKVLEIRQSASTKAAALDFWQAYHADFVLIAGDDTTDEAMFKAAPPGAVSVKVGSGSTQATYRVATPHALQNVLHQLLEITEP